MYLKEYRIRDEHTSKNILLIESIQRESRILYDNDAAYEDRLQIFSLEKLEVRVAKKTTKWLTKLHL